jgi:hypothetical protein
VAPDDGAQIDPATLPENVELMRKLDADSARREQQEDRRRALESRITAALPGAVSGIEGRVRGREGAYAREEDLRGGLAEALRANDELVLTEARLLVPGWTPNLGGFDLAVVVDDSLVVGETKWADRNLHECMWDIFKLASALSVPRVDAAVAVYGAPAKHWQKPETCARLFENRDVVSRDLILGLPHQWEINLAGSSAKPLAIPMLVKLRLLATQPGEVLGKSWEVRAISVEGDVGTYHLTDGWPHGERPAEPKPFRW